MSIRELDDLSDSVSQIEEKIGMCETRKFVKKLEIQIDILRKIIDPECIPSPERKSESFKEND